jgi:hypothetical protein
MRDMIHNLTFRENLDLIQNINQIIIDKSNQNETRVEFLMTIGYFKCIIAPIDIDFNYPSSGSIGFIDIGQKLI